MLYLPADLFNRCRDVLLSCDNFESLKRLKDVFNTKELVALKYEIPFANNQKELVDGFLGYILEKSVEGGGPEFPVFLAILRDQYTDDRKEQLAQLLEQVQMLPQAAPQISALSPHKKQELQDKLLTLDFRPQVQQFRDVIDQHRIAAFLVHGPPFHGQQVLTHRLSRYEPEWGNAQRIVIESSSPGIGFESDSLWRQVAKKMGLPHDTDRETLAEKVCEWWKTQDVIFVFLTVDYIPRKILVTWLEDFWKPISAVARRELPSIQSNTHLLLFLVDFKGHVCKTKGMFLDQPKKLGDSHAPLQLPPTAKFPKKILEGWIENSAELLPSKVDVIELSKATKNGIPNLVYEKICDYCGLSWEGDMTP